MDLSKILAELRRERDQIDEAILTLERLALSRGRRRGRPPAWMKALREERRELPLKNRPKKNAE